MRPPFTNAFAINIPVASRNNDETFAQQLFDDLIDKALSYDFNNGIDDHVDTIVVA